MIKEGFIIKSSKKNRKSKPHSNSNAAYGKNTPKSPASQRQTASRGTATALLEREPVTEPKRPIPERHAKHTQKSKSSKVPFRISRKVIIAVAVSITAIFTAVTASGLIVTNNNKIFPNLIFAGVKIGGLSVSEAAKKLDESGFSNYTGKSVLITFPTGETLSIEAEKAGVSGGPMDIANSAYQYGRNHNIYQNLMTYLSSSQDTELAIEEIFSIDETYVRDRIDGAVTSVNEKLKNSEAVIDEETKEIVLFKGSDSIVIDSDLVYTQVRNAFQERKFDPIKYMPTLDSSLTDTVDFEALYNSVFQEMQNAMYDKDSGGVTEHIDGVSFDMDAAKTLWENAQLGDEIRIPLIITEAEITAEQLKKVLFADVLAQKTTTLTSSSPRNNNITLACKAINGLILNPGEEFSYNGVVGQRTSAGGYQSAGAYADGQVVSEVGGGICQVSSTLYYTQLLANLETTSRMCHYFPVSYLPYGLDATVSWPAPDFKFKNTRDYPIKIEAYTDLSKLTMTIIIHGTDVDGSYVQMETDSWTNVTGVGAVSYRLVYDKDGNLISKKEESRSQYHNHTTSANNQSASSETSGTGTTTPTNTPPLPSPPTSDNNGSEGETTVTPSPQPTSPGSSSGETEVPTPPDPPSGETGE